MRGIFLSLVLMAAALSGAQASSFTTLHSFCAETDCADGRAPYGELARDAGGNLYGVAAGGLHGSGVVFELERAGTSWTYKTLYRFCPDWRQFKPCLDGSYPLQGVIVDKRGNLYGTTDAGGHKDAGVIYELVHKSGTWQYKMLHEFCSAAHCSDGNEPAGILSYAGAASGALYDGRSPLYGTVPSGGADGRSGGVYELTHEGANWSLNMIYTFCSLPDCEDGEYPYDRILVDGRHTLIGVSGPHTAVQGGTIWKLKRDHDHWNETVLSRFCSDSKCRDGYYPATPVMDAAGNLYGTTDHGGKFNKGVLFSLTRGGKLWYDTRLYNFCSVNKPSCDDGKNPRGLVVDDEGRLIGTALLGGPGGTLFLWDGSYHVLHEFCTADASCSDGKTPSGRVLLDDAGTMFGMTAQGGAHGQGTIYAFTP